MTNTTETTTKKIPDFNIYVQGEDGKSIQTGVAFKHSRGDGFTILIGENRYAAFPTKPKAETPEKGA